MTALREIHRERIGPIRAVLVRVMSQPRPTVNSMRATDLSATRQRRWARLLLVLIRAGSPTGLRRAMCIGRSRAIRAGRANLCGGGCHHEAMGRGRIACDYIRGWLHFCLQAYIRLSDKRPDLFSIPSRDRGEQTEVHIENSRIRP